MFPVLSPTYQNNCLSNNEESLMLDLRDHTHAEYGNRRYFCRYFFTREGEGGFCSEGRLYALESLKTQLVLTYPLDLIA